MRAGSASVKRSEATSYMPEEAVKSTGASCQQERIARQIKTKSFQ
jgi:hypothetical protein